MKKINLLFTLFLCFSVVSCSLTSGNGTDYPSENELPPLLQNGGDAGDGSAQTELEESFPGLDSLQTYRFDGKPFVVAVYEGCEFFPKGGTDAYSLALSQRNQAVQNKTGVVLTEYPNLTAASFYTDLRAAYQGGTLQCDAIVMPVRVMSLFAVNGLLQNIYSVPFLDMNATYTHADEMTAFTVGTKGFGYFSDAFENTPFLRCLFVNERGVLDVDALYESALAGDFDYDTFLTAAKESSLKNGLIYDGDREGLVVDLFCATGQNMIDYTPPKTPTMVELSEKLTAFSSRFQLLCDEVNIKFCDDDEKASDVFAAGDAAFCIGTLEDVKTLSASRVSWGILPMPNEEGGERYYSRMSDDRVCFAVMKSADLSYTGKIINTVAAASSKLKTARLTSFVYDYLPSQTAANLFSVLQTSVYSDLGIDYGGIYAVLSAASREVLVNFTVHGMEYEWLYKNAKKSFERFLKDYTFYD